MSKNIRERLNFDCLQLREYLKQPSSGYDYLTVPEGAEQTYYDLHYKAGSAAQFMDLGGINHAGGRKRHAGTLVASRVIVGVNYAGRGMPVHGRLCNQNGDGIDYEVKEVKEIDGSKLVVGLLEESVKDWSMIYPVLDLDEEFRNPANHFGAFQTNGYGECRFVQGYVHGERKEHRYKTDTQGSEPRGTIGWPMFAVLQQTPDHGQRKTNPRTPPEDINATFLPILVSLHETGLNGIAVGRYREEIEDICRDWDVGAPEFVRSLGADLGYVEPPEQEVTIKPSRFPEEDLPLWARRYDGPETDTATPVGQFLFIHTLIAKRTWHVMRVEYVTGGGELPGDVVATTNGKHWASRKEGVLYIGSVQAQDATETLGTVLTKRWPR